MSDYPAYCEACGQLITTEPPHKEAASEPIIPPPSNLKFVRSGPNGEEPIPSLEEELDYLLLQGFIQAAQNAIDKTFERKDVRPMAERMTKAYSSQLKQLILKDVLEMIGPDESVFGFYGREEAKNQLREKLRQSARKRYQS